jgi:hypothetical protein
LNLGRTENVTQFGFTPTGRAGVDWTSIRTTEAITQGQSMLIARMEEAVKH